MSEINVPFPLSRGWLVQVLVMVQHITEWVALQKWRFWFPREVEKEMLWTSHTLPANVRYAILLTSEWQTRSKAGYWRPNAGCRVVSSPDPQMTLVAEMKKLTTRGVWWNPLDSHNILYIDTKAHSLNIASSNENTCTAVVSVNETYPSSLLTLRCDECRNALVV